MEIKPVAKLGWLLPKQALFNVVDGALLLCFSSMQLLHNDRLLLF